jgi:arginase
MPKPAISLIAVPSHAGDVRHPAAAGPRRLLDAGVADLLTRAGHELAVEVIEASEPFRDSASSSGDVNREVAAVVRGALESASFPLVLAGSCVTCHGVLAGLDGRRVGAVWLDAHGDFNTPETTGSGFFPGMSLAVAVGRCYRDYWSQIGGGTTLEEKAIAMFGVRDLSPDAEREHLEASAIDVVEWRDGEPQRDVLAALEEVASCTREVYLHVDFDVFAPDVAPGIADDPVAGGLSAEQAEEIVRVTAERVRICAATLATFAPEHDRDDRTLRLGLRMIEAIGLALPD